MMTVLLTWLAGSLASLIGYSTVRFVAWKLVAYTLLVTVLPIVLMNVLYSVIDGAMTLATSAQNTYGLSSTVMELTGLAAWFAIYLKMVEGVSLLLTALTFRMALRAIPFVRL